MSRNPLHGVDLNLLLALDRLLAHHSVTAAARDLGLSQPATSRALGRLREALGDPLLVRVGRELVPTPRATELEEPLAAALAAARRVFEPPVAFDAATATGELVLAMGDEAQIALGAAIVAALSQAVPGVDVRLSALSAATVEDGRRGRIDLAIAPDLAALPASAGSVDLSEFVTRPLYTRRFVLAVPDARAGEAWDLDRFCAADHVMVSLEAGGWGFVDDLLAGIGRSRRVAVSVTTFPAAARLVAATRLVSTLPHEVVASLGEGVTARPHPLAPPDLPMLLVWHPRLSRDPRHKFLREVVRGAVVARVASWSAPDRAAPDPPPGR